ncbi:hypothetical protein GOP47_0013151 [Adiantum capillus-veneris]|uniref:Late embryogenesis abundant protein LEA-2 subgroup domain-containing protein n=1 Tax=Adiantum capillus-veneris TaxID=13818 RepID=A0A9D4ZF11_ADICA|nr:hypothetical protein GOP47_0013151 [Adiantum capillus-veneris]
MMQQQQQSKWESSTDLTTLPGSSPPRSPSTHFTSTRVGAAGKHSSSRPSNSFYYVQSPSQYDGDSIYNYRSGQSSPTASPGHPMAGDSRRSGGGKPGAHGKAGRFSSKCSVIDEENDGFHRTHPYQHPTDRLSARLRLFLFILVCCGALLGLIILLIWLSTRPSAPQVSVKNMVFHNLYIGPGKDASGVPTNMLTLNCTVQIEFNNTSKHLKAHLQPLHIDILYSKLSIATSKLKDYSQGKRSRKVIPIQMQASKVALYGASYELPTTDETVELDRLSPQSRTSVQARTPVYPIA